MAIESLRKRILDANADCQDSDLRINHQGAKRPLGRRRYAPGGILGDAELAEPVEESENGDSADEGESGSAEATMNHINGATAELPRRQVGTIRARSRRLF